MKKIFLSLLLILLLSSWHIEVQAKPQEMNWEDFESTYQRNQNLKLLISEVSVEGLFADNDEFILFIPIKELVRNINLDQDDADIIRELEAFIDREVMVRIIALNKEDLLITFSERDAYLDTLTTTNSNKFFEDNDSKNGIITHADRFGIFVRFGDGTTYSEKFIQLSAIENGSGQNFQSGQIINITPNQNGSFSTQQISNGLPATGDIVNAKVVGVSNENLLVEVAPGIIDTIPLDSLAEPGTPKRERLNQAVRNQETIPVRINSINPQAGTADVTPTDSSSLGGAVSGAASGGTGASASAQAGGAKREERQLSFDKRREMYECVFELPEKEDCKEDKYREYAVKAWKDEYEDYRSLLEDIYYDNNCTWQDIVAILFSEQEDDIECEQRVTEDLEEIGLEQERPSRLNRYVTCVEMIPETADRTCYEHLEGEITFTRFIRLIELVKDTAGEVVRHGMYLTEVLFEERLKRRELIAIQEEVYHRSDQLWQKLSHMNFNYWKEMEEFKFKWYDQDAEQNRFIRCVERAQVALQWIKEKSIIF